MAKSIEGICKDIREWRNKNPEARSVLLIAGYEEDNIRSLIGGPKQELVENIATELVKNRNINEITSQAIRIALEYANEKVERD
ncbi:MAG: hypothetical protein J6B83_03285 [Bacteroidaceae bacterium]|nr:hypothetical protein [Bacteroidaceae bacterium]